MFILHLSSTVHHCSETKPLEHPSTLITRMNDLAIHGENEKGRLKRIMMIKYWIYVTPFGMYICKSIHKKFETETGLFSYYLNRIVLTICFRFCRGTIIVGERKPLNKIANSLCIRRVKSNSQMVPLGYFMVYLLLCDDSVSAIMIIISVSKRLFSLM